MSEQPRTRQELYNLIRSKGGKDTFVLEEMIRLGFWPERGVLPEDPADEIRRMGELRRELEELRRESRRLHDEKQLRREALKKRLEESRRKQQENKERRERERRDRAEAWQRRKEREIVYLGEGVSGGLSHREGDLERLQGYGLPILNNAEQIAAAIGISVGELRFLAFNRKTATQTHYIRFKMPKKMGGERLISAPMPRLKRVQHWIAGNILNRVELNEAAHGFRRDRSILTNARPHVGADVIINYDLKDFFPNISYKRVKGVFRSLGYSEMAATIFGLLCTEADLEEVELDGKTYYVALGDRHLPQGSPASPALSNILFRRCDRRLQNMATHLSFTYTRYADDLTFSASGDNLRSICNLLRRTESIINHEGFIIHPEKLRIMRRKSSRLEVTGIVVNDYPNLDRKTLKRFRATLFHLEKDGIEGKHWGQGDNVMVAVQGFANFVNMVNPTKGKRFLEQIDRIREKWGLQQPKKRSVSPPDPASEISESSAETLISKAEAIAEEGIILECYKQGSKLKVRVISEGYNSRWNVQIPRNLMEEGARYRVAEIRESAVGGFYRTSGKIQKL